MTAQVGLFDVPRERREVQVPAVLDAVLMRPDAALFVSISGGKDGHAMLKALVRLHRARGWRCAIICIHAHLGRAEWKESLPHCHRIADEAGLTLIVTHRLQGDLVQEIEDRKNKLCGSGEGAGEPLEGSPFWPAPESRYCTAHHKENQIDKVLRPYKLVVSAMGMRAQESAARAKKNPFRLDATLTAKRLREMSPDEAYAAWNPEGKERLAYDWMPVFDWGVDEVWEEIGTNADELELRRRAYAAGHQEDALDGWPGHPAYVYGNERVSCALCVLGSPNDLRVGALHNPELFRLYVSWEDETGFTFQHKRALSSIAPELLVKEVA